MRRQLPFNKPPPVPGTPHHQSGRPHVHDSILEAPPCYPSDPSSSRERSPSQGSFARGAKEKERVVGSAKDLQECVACWLTYIQFIGVQQPIGGVKHQSSSPLKKKSLEMYVYVLLPVHQALSGLCLAGLQLAQCMHQLLGPLPSPHTHVAGQCVAAWESITKVVLASSTALRAELLAALQEAATRLDRDGDGLVAPELVQLLSRNLVAFIQLQYHFCLVCGECLSSIPRPPEEDSFEFEPSPQPQVQTQAQNQGQSMGQPQAQTQAQPCRMEGEYVHLTPPPQSMPAPRLPSDLLPRRWSMFSSTSYLGDQISSSASAGFLPRRWSSPGTHEAGWRAEHGFWGQRRSSGSRSSSGTPDSRKSGFASSDEIQDVINLLSCKLSSSSSPGSESSFSYVSGSSHEQSFPLWPPSGQVPGVTLTSYAHDEQHGVCSGSLPSEKTRATGTWPRMGASNGWNLAAQNQRWAESALSGGEMGRAQSATCGGMSAGAGPMSGRRSSSPWLSPEAHRLHRPGCHRSSWPNAPDCSHTQLTCSSMGSAAVEGKEFSLFPAEAAQKQASAMAAKPTVGNWMAPGPSFTGREETLQEAPHLPYTMWPSGDVAMPLPFIQEQDRGTQSVASPPSAAGWTGEDNSGGKDTEGKTKETDSSMYMLFGASD